MRPILLILPLAVLGACTSEHDRDVQAALSTAIDTRDRYALTVTPTDCSNAKADLELLQDVRQALVEDETLASTVGKVRVTALDGNVVLRGSVATALERNRIEERARACDGTRSVHNLIGVEIK
jgi:osmotically-inducible protein OsmY